MGRAENKVATHLLRRCKELGIVAEKVHAEDRVGCPDYILTFPDGYIARVETKSDNGEVSPSQGYYHRMLAKNRCKVIVPTCPEDGEAYLTFEMRHHSG
jgi:hypothetical protein